MTIITNTLKALGSLAFLIIFSSSVSLASTSSIPPIISLILDSDAIDTPTVIPEVPEVGDKPGAHNTGPTNESILVKSGSVDVKSSWKGGGSGTPEDPFIVENLDIEGSLKIRVPNVIVRNFRVSADGLYPLQANYDDVDNVIIEDGEVIGGLVDTSAVIIAKNGVTLRRLEIHESGNDGVKVQGSNFTMENCWVYNLGAKEGAHADGVQGTVTAGRWSNHVYRNNFFDMSVSKLQGIYRSNIMIFLHQENSATESGVDGIIIENNWLIGGNWSIQLTEDMTDIILRDNKFGRISDDNVVRDVRFGHIIIDSDDKIVSGNTYEDTGELIPNQ